MIEPGLNITFERSNETSNFCIKLIVLIFTFKMQLEICNLDKPFKSYVSQNVTDQRSKRSMRTSQNLPGIP